MRGREIPTTARRAALLGAGLALLAIGAPAGASASDGAHASIIGGKSSSIAEFPSLAFIESSNGREAFACTGSVIAPRVILTAAHCADDLDHGGLVPPRSYAVLTGAANLAQAGPALVTGVRETHVFPGFDPSTAHGDAALLILERATAAPPLPIAGPADAALFGTGVPVRAAGWGLTRFDARNSPNGLRSASMVVQEAGFCGRKTKPYYPEYSSAQQICALDRPDKRSGGCFGDSGGPAIATRPDGSPVEIGIFSIVGPGCTTKRPNVFTRTDLVAAWAAEWVAATEAGAPPPVVDNGAPLPNMPRALGEIYALFTLADHFGTRFLNATRIDGSCHRASRARFDCRVNWRAGRFAYKGSVNPFYTRQRGAVVWDSHFRISWIDLECRDRRPARACPARSQHG
jgi:secreted trypsin-like serine protease